ncbi:hypothetical protein OQA88_4407 [Cercophora sp. LCS_1]
MIPADQRFQVTLISRGPADEAATALLAELDAYTTDHSDEPSTQREPPSHLLNQPINIIYTLNLHDADQRRSFTISLTTSTTIEVYNLGEPIHRTPLDPYLSQPSFITKIENAPLGIFNIEITPTLNLISLPDRPSLNPSHPTYPPLGAFPPGAPTILRSELIELERISRSADRVTTRSNPNTYSGLLFKPCLNTQAQWTELQILSRIPPNRNMIPIEYLVLDEITAKHVVGFTTRYYPDGNLKSEYYANRPFRLRWFTQLMRAVDELNLQYGIIHGDIKPEKVLIDPISGYVKLVGFDKAKPVGEAERDDVAGVVRLLHWVLTGDEKFDAEDFLDHASERKISWKERDDTVDRLDDHPKSFIDELGLWVTWRRSSECRFGGEQYIRWPVYPPSEGEKTDSSVVVPARKTEESEEKLKGPVAGAEYDALKIPWQRPPSSLLDDSRTLLCTGEYAEEGTSPGGLGLGDISLKRKWDSPEDEEGSDTPTERQQISTK